MLFPSNCQPLVQQRPPLTTAVFFAGCIASLFPIWRVAERFWVREAVDIDIDRRYFPVVVSVAVLKAATKMLAGCENVA